MRRFARFVATAGGIGYLPVAPGTLGSLLVLPVVPWIAAGPPLAVALGVVAVTALAVWAAALAEDGFDVHDDGRVVIDEVAGMVVMASLVPTGWRAALLGFVAFRLFDVWKPPPIGWLDRRVGGGVGVVADDLLAGVYAGLLVRVLVEFM